MEELIEEKINLILNKEEDDCDCDDENDALDDEDCYEDI